MNKIINKIIDLFHNKNNEKQQIIYTHDNIRQRLSNMYIAGKTVSESLHSILLELGISPNEQITVTECNYHDNNDLVKQYYIACYKDNNHLFNLGFGYEGYFSETPRLIVINHTTYIDFKKEYAIKFIETDSKKKIKIDQISYEEKYSDGRKYRRDYSIETANGQIKKGEYELVFKIERPCDETIEKNPDENYCKYELHYEAELIRYLIELKFPTQIEEVYKKICEISLENNISNYPFICIYITKKDKATDYIEIEYGEWKRFQITKEGKNIVIYPNGYWGYELDGNSLSNIDTSDELSKDSTLKFSMSFDSKGISYVVNAKSESEIDDYTNTLAMYDITTARSEVENTKKLVRELIKK